MSELIQRIGISVFIQIVIECWNNVFLLIMFFSIIIGKLHDGSANFTGKVKIPLTNEILIFYIVIFLYNACDILCASSRGDTSTYGFYMNRISEFAYDVMGAFQTLFFLQIIKKHIAEKKGLDRLRKVIFSVQLLQIPSLFLLAVTPFTNALYYFDDQNYYHRGPFYDVWNYITIISFIFIIAVYIAFRKKTDRFLGQIIITASVIPMICFILNFTYTGISFNNISVIFTTLIIFMLYEKHKTTVSIQNARELEKVQTQLAESRLALERSKNETLMAQIQPHFINNSLMALRSRCSDYPEIYESITNFSRYLRSNFEALGDTRLILFEQEMENIEAYLALEKQNFGERLQVEYDIDCDDFLIPALSVQPLVENAVRHGVATYEKGGTVQISAHRAGGKVIIEVIDDGSGRSNITEQQTKRKGIGIKNVRARLHSMSNGELEIISGEHSTTARITVANVQSMGGTQ